MVPSSADPYITASYTAHSWSEIHDTLSDASKPGLVPQLSGARALSCWRTFLGNIAGWMCQANYGLRHQPIAQWAVLLAVLLAVLRAGAPSLTDRHVSLHMSFCSQTVRSQEEHPLL